MQFDNCSPRHRTIAAITLSIIVNSKILKYNSSKKRIKVICIELTTQYFYSISYFLSCSIQMSLKFNK